MNFITTFNSSFNREINWLKSSFWNWGMISLLPLLAGLLIWYIFSSQIPRNLPIGILDQDHTSISRRLVRYLDASPGLLIKEQYSNFAEAENSLKKGSVYAVIVIPKETTRNIKTQRKANIILHHNAQFGTHSPLIEKDVITVVSTLSAGIEIHIKKKKGTTSKTAFDTFNPLQNILVPMFNKTPDYQIYLASAIIPALLHIVAMMTGAYIFGRELRDKTITDWLIHINLKKINYLLLSGYILGKIMPSIIGLTFISIIFFLIFYQAIQATFLAFVMTFLSFIIFLILCILMGGYFSTIALSLRKGLTISSFISAPSFAFSGIGFPLLAMPTSAYLWTNILPLTHYLHIQVAQLQMGAPYTKTILIILGFIFFAFLFFIFLHFLVVRALSKPDSWGGR